MFPEWRLKDLFEEPTHRVKQKTSLERGSNGPRYKYILRPKESLTIQILRLKILSVIQFSIKPLSSVPTYDIHYVS